MLIAVIIVSVLLLWWAVAGSRANKQRVMAERRLDLELWERREDDDPYVISWRLHFPSMRMQEDSNVTDTPGMGQRLNYIVRRTPAGAWQQKLTSESRDAEVAHLRSMVKSLPRSSAGPKARLAVLEAGPVWDEVREDNAAAIEGAYQRYIRQAP